jgi:hypothetical protein
MSGMGRKRTLKYVRPMSALPPKADIQCDTRNIRFVPQADIRQIYSITSSARRRNDSGMAKPSVIATTTGRRRRVSIARMMLFSDGLSPLRCQVLTVSKLNPCSSRLPNDCPNEQ